MLIGPLVFLAHTALNVLLFLVLARVLLQACKADRYNPIAQGVVKVTDPVLAPLRRVLPKSMRWDVAGILVSLLLGVLLVVVDYGFDVSVLMFPQGWLFGVLRAVNALLDFYFVLILILVVASFIAPGSYHPASVLARQLTDPIMAPVQRLLPAMGGFDFSPMVVITIIVMLQRFVIGPMMG